MKILFVAPYPISRIRIRSYGFVSQLAKVHDVTVLTLCSNVHEAMDVSSLRMEGVTFISVAEKRQAKVMRSIKALSTKQPLQVAYDASPAWQDAIRQQLSTGHFDLLHVEFIRALGALPDSLPIPAVWDAVDCISQLYAYGAQFGATPLLRMVGRLEAQRTREYEYIQLGRFQNVLVTSERDRQALLNIKGQSVRAGKQDAEITVLAHGVDQEYFQPYSGKRHAQTLVFSGKMSFHANVAGALHLVKCVMPLIWRQRPAVKLVIVGSKPPMSIQRLARDTRIEVTGYVSDMRPYIEQAQIAVCPLPYAVGIQNKMLEAMALGTPVVASSYAAAGLQASDGEDLLVADQPEHFAVCVLRLLDDQGEWSRLSQNALKYISLQHNWAQIVTRLTAIYSDAMNNAHALL